MGLRCLLGHDFDDPELRREREEQGNEVVVTVREEKTCTRCGYTKTVSENKEVTSIEQLAETADGEREATTAGDTDATAADTDATAADDAGAAATTGETASPPPGDETASSASPPTAADQPADATTHSADADDAELLDDEETPPASTEPTAATADAAEEPPAADSEEAGGADGSEPQAADDDGIILSTADDETDETADETAESEGEPGGWEWPEHETDPETTAHEWPEQSGDDEGYDAETPPAEQPDDVNFSGGFTPEATADAVDDDGVDAQTDEEMIEEPADAELTKAGEATVYEPTVDDITTEFYCPECGFTRHAGASSMRAGDICPECQRGYIAEREL